MTFYSEGQFNLASLAYFLSVQCSVAKSRPIFASPWTVAHQDSLSFTVSRSLLKFITFESVMPNNHHILCRPLLLLPSIFPSIRLFSNKSAYWTTLGGQSIGASVSASVLSMNSQGWFPLGLTGLISLLSEGLSRVFSSTTIHLQHDNSGIHVQ